jgi:phosphoribosylformylglycinamidine synthase
LDTKYAFEKLGCETKIVWHKETKLPDDTKLVVIAGGFSYGDYLRSGAIAQFSPIMKVIVDYAKE